MYGMAQHQWSPPYVGMMKNPAGKQCRTYQGIPQVPFQGQHIQTQPFQPLQGYPRVDKKGYTYVVYQNPPYSDAQVPLYQKPPYLGIQVPISQDIPSYPGYPLLDFKRYLPFVETLEFLVLTRLTNDFISHSRWWLITPTKFPSDIPKFKGNPGECPSTHLMMYHLWFSSNSFNNDSIQLRFSNILLQVPQRNDAFNYLELRFMISVPQLPPSLHISSCASGIKLEQKF